MLSSGVSQNGQASASTFKHEQRGLHDQNHITSQLPLCLNHSKHWHRSVERNQMSSPYPSPFFACTHAQKVYSSSRNFLHLHMTMPRDLAPSRSWYGFGVRQNGMRNSCFRGIMIGMRVADRLILCDVRVFKTRRRDCLNIKTMY